LLACGDANGQIVCQTVDQAQTFDFFQPSYDTSGISPRFGSILPEGSPKVNVAYMTFIDDTTFLAVSNRSQIFVVDAQAPTDTLCSSWMSPPDLCESILVDYNSESFRILECSTPPRASIFDLPSQKRTLELRVEKGGGPTCLQWLRPFPHLFTIVSPNLNIYDERIPESHKVASIEGMDDSVVGCNASMAMPLYLVFGKASGQVDMFDLRMLTRVAHTDIKRPLRQFEVHRHLPFAMGMSDQSVFALNFGDGKFTPTAPPFQGTASDFCLHPSEPACAIRAGNRVTYVDFPFSLQG
jgi:hypothetical protein